MQPRLLPFAGAGRCVPIWSISQPWRKRSSRSGRSVISSRRVRALSAIGARTMVERFFRARGDMRFAFIARRRHIRPVSSLCEALEVSRCGFHAWQGRPTSTREIHEPKLVMAIESSFKASDRTYGARRVWHDVLEEGLACGLHRTLRLMRCNAFKARPRRRGKPRDDGELSIIADIEPVNATGSTEPARLDRDFQGRSAKPEVAGRFHIHLDCRGLAVCRASPWSLGPSPIGLEPMAPRWATAPTARFWTCFSAARQVWSMKADRNAPRITDALMMAVWRREKAAALLHHSDQGSQGGLDRSSQHGQFQRS